MNAVLCFILGLLFVSIMGALCFFSCYLSSKADEYWNDLKQKLEKRNERH